MRYANNDKRRCQFRAAWLNNLSSSEDECRDVAAFFGKRHDHVIRDIRSLIAKEAKLGLPNFGELKIKDLTGPD